MFVCGHVANVWPWRLLFYRPTYFLEVGSLLEPMVHILSWGWNVASPRCSCLGCLRAGIAGIHLMLGLLYGIQTPVLMIVQQALFPNDPCLSLSLLLLFLRQVSCNPGWLQTYYEAKDDFEFLIQCLHLLSVGICSTITTLYSARD